MSEIKEIVSNKLSEIIRPGTPNKTYKCNCVNVEMQSYDNQYMISDLPDHMEKFCEIHGIGNHSICLDRCIAPEILILWNKGITTTGHCCGHNKLDPYIGVIDEDIDKMKKLGYEVSFNHMRPEDEDSFKPKMNI